MDAGEVGAKEARRERTAARLRAAAREAFGELGWNAARVEDIVSRAGVSHGTFYTYYPNKIAVLVDLVEGSQRELARLADDTWEADDVRHAIERVVGGLLELYERDAVVVRTWLQAARDEPELGERYATTRRRFVERVSENVEAVAEAGGVSDRPSSFTVAAALVAMVEHLAYSWFVLGEPHRHEDVIDSVVLIWGASLNALAGFEVVSFA
jgi:AcrR family transcriptional regulator